MYVGELKEIDNLIFSGKGREAYKALKRYLKKEPASSDANAMLAMVLAKHKPKAAKRYLQKIENNAKIVDKTYYYISMAYALLGNEGYAKRYAHQGLVKAIQKKDRNLVNNISLVYETLCDYKRAIKTIEEALKLGEYTRGWHNLARFHLKSGNLLEAQKCIDRALLLPPDPTHTPQLILKGEILVQLGKYADAKECFNKASENDPEHIAGYYPLAKMYMELEDYEKVIECCDEVLHKSYKSNIARLQKDALKLQKYKLKMQKKREVILEKELRLKSKKYVTQAFVHVSKKAIRIISASPDGRFLCVLKKDGSLQMFQYFENKKEWKEVWNKKFDKKIRYVSSSHDCKNWFVATKKELICISNDGEVCGKIKLPKGDVSCISSIGRNVLFAMGKVLYAYNYRMCEGGESWKFSFGSNIRKVFVKRDKAYVLLPNEIGIFDSFGTLITIKQFKHRIANISISDNEETRIGVFCNASNKGLVFVLDSSGKTIWEQNLPFPPENGCISKDNRKIAILSLAYDIYYIDLDISKSEVDESIVKIGQLRVSPLAPYSNIFFLNGTFILATSNLHMQIFKLKDTPSLIYNVNNKQKYITVEKMQNGEWFVVSSKKEIHILKIIKEKTKVESKENDSEGDSEPPLPINCT